MIRCMMTVAMMLLRRQKHLIVRCNTNTLMTSSFRFLLDLTASHISKHFNRMLGYVAFLSLLPGSRAYSKLHNLLTSSLAKSITENFLVPIHFPWHSSAKLSQKIVKTLPRDIDDLPIITHCLDELHAPFGDFLGPFGFGRYENGQSKGNYSSTTPAETKSNPDSEAFTSARRSDDPGAIELYVRIPSSPIDAVVTTAKDAHSQAPGAKRSSLMLSHLPFNWKKKDGYPHSTYNPAIAKPTAQFNDSNIESLKLAEVRSRSFAQLVLAKSCMRKWRVSMKVGGISSRTTLFPSSYVKLIDPKDDHVHEHSRTVLRPMLCIAVLPQSVQSGLTVSLEKASAMDNDGLARSLGSYDCRFTDALLNPKRDVSNRVKRIEVGRTRLVWSNLPVDEPYLPSTRNRVNFNSLITGRRIASIKRPREVKVGVRLNGRLMMEEATEDLPSATNENARKRKHSLRQAETEGPASKPSVGCPMSRTDAEIDAALRFLPLGRLQGDIPPENGSVVYLEMGARGICDSNIDRNEIIASLLKFNQKKLAKKKLKQSASNDTTSVDAARMVFRGGQVIKTSNPLIACVPLEDGLLRTVCLNAGNMAGSSVHLVLRSLREEDSKRCSVCWNDDGSGEEGVQECVDCRLLAHSSCCRDKGQFSSNFTGSQPLDPHKEMNQASNHPNGKIKNTTECSDARVERWKCAVCCHYTQATPRRKPKIPSRFVHEETCTVSNHPEDNDVANRSANVPGPQCFLCPHRGGAMSLLELSQGSDRNSQKWVHEVCRIWSGRGVSDDSKEEECSSLFPRLSIGSPLVNVCALCGTGRMNGIKQIPCNDGLTRCAARGCLIAFHPMCALLASKVLASKVGMNDEVSKVKSVRARKTRRTEHIEDAVKSNDKEKIAADQKLSLEYTLQLVQLIRAEGGGKVDNTVIPVAFCGIHNPLRDNSFYGCLPCGVVI
jgi:hypothetical protein